MSADDGEDPRAGRPGGETGGRAAGDRHGPGAVRRAVSRFRTAEGGALAFVRELLSSAVLVLLVGAVLFAVSGVWPPMVAVESGSMNPHMHRGDLVFVVSEQRLAADGAIAGTGVVPQQVARETGYTKFGGYGDVIVYHPDGQAGPGPPIIHRAMFYVERGENWYDEANESYLRADSCRELTYCPAPNEGFITKGDNPRTNRYYDQARGMSRPVKPAWVQGKAMVRIPALGWIRLKWAELQRGAVSLGLGALAVEGTRRTRAAS